MIQYIQTVTSRSIDDRNDAPKYHLKQRQLVSSCYGATILHKDLPYGQIITPLSVHITMTNQDFYADDLTTSKLHVLF